MITKKSQMPIQISIMVPTTPTCLATLIKISGSSWDSISLSMLIMKVVTFLHMPPIWLVQLCLIHIYLSQLVWMDLLDLSTVLQIKSASTLSWDSKNNTETTGQRMILEITLLKQWNPERSFLDTVMPSLEKLIQDSYAN